jgi:hypothetical protein
VPLDNEEVLIATLDSGQEIQQAIWTSLLTRGGPKIDNIQSPSNEFVLINCHIYRLVKTERK